MIHFKKQIIITALVLFSIYYGIFGPSTGCLGSLKNSKEYNKCIKQLKKLCGKSLNATSCGENIFKKKLYDDFKGDDKIYSHGYYNYLTTFVYLGNILSIPNYCQAVSYFSSTDRKIFIDKCEKILYIYFNTDSTISGDEVKDAFNFVFKYMYEESKPHFNDTVKKFFMDMETELEFREDIKSRYTWCEQNTYWSKDQLEELCRVHIDASECGIYMFKEKLYDDFKGDDKKYARGFYEYVRTAVDLEDIPTIPEYCKKASKKRSIKYKPQFIAACENILNKFFNIDTNILDISDNHKKKCFDFTFISLNQEMYKYDTVIVERYVEHMFKAVSFYNDTKNGEQWCKGQTRT